MPEEYIKNYFNKNPFINKKWPIFQSNCIDAGCELKGNFNDYIIMNGDNIMRCLQNDEKSVDFIIFAKKVTDNKLDIILCELSSGKKKYSDVVEKVKHSSEYILNVFCELGFKINDFICVFLGEYKNEKRVIQKSFSIPGYHRNDIHIQKFRCGINIAEFYSGFNSIT